jgi:hypothetical protein
MVQRLRLGPGGDSPLVLSVASVDVNGASYINQVFNANTKTLRVWQTGLVQVDVPASPGALPLPVPVGGPGGFVTPGGTFPVFLVMGRRTDANDLRPAFRDIGGTGLGGLMSPSGQFIAWSQSRNSLPTSYYVNFCIFRNYG